MEGQQSCGGGGGRHVIKWECSKGHTWRSTIERMKRTHNCPVCQESAKRIETKKDGTKTNPTDGE